MSTRIRTEDILIAANRLKDIVKKTPCEKNLNYSEKYDANIFFKREDLQFVRSYKLRGAYNKIVTLSEQEKQKGVVCASAGNHAQGVAFACRELEIQGTIFMPTTTPKQKIKQVKMFGRDQIDIRLEGDTFDDSSKLALDYSKRTEATFVHPFDDQLVIEGQGTVALEILESVPNHIDYLIAPIGGGGLISGLVSYFKNISPDTQIIGVEPKGAPSMKTSLERDTRIRLDKIDKFVDGAAVKEVGELNFAICRGEISAIYEVEEGKICTSILELYNQEAIVVEPAGALTVASLDFLKNEIKGKNVVCIISGGNNDIDRMQEIKERSLLYEGLKHYFLIDFPQRPGALKDFVAKVLGPTDDITLFEYAKKNIKESGPALVGIELADKNDYESLLKRMKDNAINYTLVNENHSLFEYLIM